MSKANDPINSLYGNTKTDNHISNIHVIYLNNVESKNKNDYKTFYEKGNFEKHIEMYPITEVKKRVLGRVRIPD